MDASLPIPANVPRRVAPLLDDLMRAFRVVILAGARQSGKTTLARSVAERGGVFLSLDDPSLLEIAREDPLGFVEHRARPVVIDEVQRGGDDLVRAVKLAVDANPSPGAFLLTGSADFLTVPRLSESLAGRAAFVELMPFSEAEMGGTTGLLEILMPDALSGDLASLCDDLLSSPASDLTRSDYAERVCRGGYPEALRMSAADRRRWFDGYVRTIVARDITELTGARRAWNLPTLLNAAAARTAGEFVLEDLHRDAGFGAITTTADYVSHLEMAYLLTRLPSWSTSPATRIKRRPKIHLTDTGLAAALLGVTAERLLAPADRSRGSLFETFTVNELRRQATALREQPRIHHYRDRQGREIDLVVEYADGQIIGLEVKSGLTVRPSDAKSLIWLRDSASDHFALGLIFYAGQHPLKLSDRILALPMSYLWTI